MAKNVDELPVYQAASKLVVAVSATFASPAWGKDFHLRDQLRRAVQSVPANIEEGFEQGTDRAFARYLTIAKGSAAETAGHLRRAAAQGCLAKADATPLRQNAEEISRMLGGFIKYLHRRNFKDRGHFRPSNRSQDPEDTDKDEG